MQFQLTVKQQILKIFDAFKNNFSKRSDYVTWSRDKFVKRSRAWVVIVLSVLCRGPCVVAFSGKVPLVSDLCFVQGLCQNSGKPLKTCLMLLININIAVSKVPPPLIAYLSFLMPFTEVLTSATLLIPWWRRIFQGFWLCWSHTCHQKLVWFCYEGWNHPLDFTLLTSRRQRVQYQSTLFEWDTLSCGVSRAPSLVPLLSLA